MNSPPQELSQMPF